MDITGWLIVAGSCVVILIIAMSILHADAGRLRRERERNDPLRPSATPGPAPLPPERPVVDARISINQRPTRGTNSPAPPEHNPDPRIVFGSTNADLKPMPGRTSPISFGAEVHNERKCPACRRLITSGVAALECEGCHILFHTQCWHEHDTDRTRPCPQCKTAKFRHYTG